MSETTETLHAEAPRTHARTMEEEIDHLRTNFQGQCKVIDMEGKFVKIVKLHPEDLDIVFNFKVTGNYTYLICFMQNDSL